MPRRYEDMLEKEIAANRQLREFLQVVRKKVHYRVFACADAAQQEREANGATELADAFNDESVWCDALLAEIDAQIEQEESRIDATRPAMPPQA